MYLTAIQAPQEDEIDALRMGLTDYNVSQAGCYLRERIASVIKDEQGKIHGGIIADIRWGWLHVDWLWVDESIRQRGWGRRLLGAMEQYAQSKGITRYHLETTTFQALPFYQALGYQVFGQLPDMPPGHLCYFLNKQL
ncbi:GNAT family N-acetyltransferase [Aeromonas cavernicola]|uniref:GNAT family N-acetyltransferase n=1 Tax=Aeromonas cavernicola TaxID=1006623 RepID=A0A2H9U8V1_9GAMM|nr:GNAT family N-acetyltransferase [Aeromonas cavernicola]PJG60455.1 GNAT family N-acetyltransferase [Aeromonas cavernicola]